MLVAPFGDHTFRRLAEQALDGVIAHSAGRIVWANEAAAKLVGAASASDLLGLSTMDFVAPESRPMALDRVRQMLATGESVPFIEEEFVTLDGRRLPVEVSASPLGDGVIVVAVRDLRPRRDAERERRTADARARAFFDATTGAIGISRVGVHVEVNAAYARLFGYEDPAELVGVPIFDVLDPAEHARVAANVRGRSTGEPRPTSYSVRGRRRDGTGMLLDVQISTYLDDDALTTIVVMRDITAQRAYEAKLAASELRYRELVAQVPVGVWEEDASGAKVILDELRARGVADFNAHFAAHPEDIVRCAQALRVRSVNPAACELVGAKDEAELLANLHSVFLSESMPDFALELAQLMEGQRTATTEGWNGTLAGERRWVAVRAALVDGHEDDWERLLVTTTDMTDRWKAREEKAALEHQRRHGEKLEAIGRLAGGVAHDFNNLLAAILGHAEVSLEQAPVGSSLHESLVGVREASLRARDLVRQILTFGRKDQPNRRPYDLSSVVTDALGLARAAIPTTVAFDVSVAPGVGTILADRTQVHQIVLNLCANAHDAVGASGRVTVTLERLSPEEGSPLVAVRAQARLRVQDDGVGMDEATRARIFEPYMTTKGHLGGHGLGLAVVHGIVAGVGGAIVVESEPRQGARFDVYFPLVATEPVRPMRPVVVTGGTERVLLVEDDALVRTALRRLLQSLGYRVTLACDGVEALTLLRAEPSAFDLVLSDQTMPNLSGLELAREVLAEQPAARILLCTGFSDSLDESSVLAAGVKGLIAKPVEKATLAAALRQALA